MLSTAQALQLWEEAVSLLRQHGNTHGAAPDPLHLPLCLGRAYGELATPHRTWERLLQKQVPLTLLTACRDLMQLDDITAVSAAQALLSSADAALTSPTAVRGSNGTRLLAILREQIEQSGFLQLLPGLLSSSIQALQTRMAAAGPSRYESPGITTSGLLNLAALAQELLPSFLSAHAAGQPCLLPLMQLALLGLQHTSKALAHAGRQLWMEDVLPAAWNGVHAAFYAVGDLPGFWARTSSGAQQAAATARSSAGSGPHSRPGSSPAVAAVLRAQQTVQCCCLQPLVGMLVQFVQANASGTAHGSSSASSSAAATGSRRAAGSVPAGGQWLPAALAPSMPAAYSNLLERVGCSREVGLWLALVLEGGQQQQQGSRGQDSAQSDVPLMMQDGCLGYVLGGLGLYDALLDGLGAYDFSQDCPPPGRELAPLLVAMPAATLQWLSNILTPERLSRMGTQCAAACAQTLVACRFGRAAITVNSLGPQGQQQPTGDLALARAASRTIVVLSADVLGKLLGICRALQPPNSSGGANPSTGGSSSSGSGRGAGSSASGRGVGSSGSASAGRGAPLSDRDVALQSCRDVVEMLACGLAVTGEAGVRVRLAADGEGGDPQQLLPVGCAQLCEPVQEFVRLTVADAAGAATPQAAAAAFAHVVGVLEASHGLFFDLFSSNAVWASGGPLAAPLAAAGDASSPDAMQLFGLLCSLLKAMAFVSTSSSMPLGQQLGAGGDLAGFQAGLVLPMVSRAVFNAVSCMLRAALGPVRPSSIQEMIAMFRRSTPSTAALPWLVLLGRCCLVSGALVQRGQLSGQWWLHGSELNQSLQLLQSGIASAWLWMNNPQNAQQLAPLGYQTRQLEQQLQEASSALVASIDELQTLTPYSVSPSNTRSAGTVLQALQEKLKAGARVLSSFAIPGACNNLTCVDCSGPSEAQLVAGRSCKCGGCRTARYCGKDCQRQAWRQHKPVCRALAAATAAAAAADGGVAGPPAESGSRAAG